MTTATRPTAARPEHHRKATAASAGLPDPRPVTSYTVAVTIVGGNAKVTITLEQPCVIRSPRWSLVDVSDGSTSLLPPPTVVSPTVFYYTVTGGLGLSVAFIDVPYQDTQVQNFQGGFVKSGGQWFRAPLGP